MTLRLGFAGWFQCRLATDPDPPDEPRGVSGYAVALAGEPDLDRIIRFQLDGAYVRPFCDPIVLGVSIRTVEGGGERANQLIGANVRLLDDPVFEGRNGIVAEAEYEPIVPFHLEIAKGEFLLRRKHADAEEFPYTELRAKGGQAGMPDVAEATGISDLWSVWQSRCRLVEQALSATSDPVVRAALQARLDLLLRNQKWTRYFPFRMIYGFDMRGRDLVYRDYPQPWISDTPIVSDDAWHIEFWMGGWDPDAFCGYVKGLLSIPALTYPGKRTDVIVEDMPRVVQETERP